MLRQFAFNRKFFVATLEFTFKKLFPTTVSPQVIPKIFLFRELSQAVRKFAPENSRLLFQNFLSRKYSQVVNPSEID